jgi:hypothetical protein
MSVLSGKVIVVRKDKQMSKGIEWVVTGKTEDGTVYRGVQVAWYGHPAMKFFAERKGVTFVFSTAEKKFHFDNFLEKGLREPLTDDELS